MENKSQKLRLPALLLAFFLGGFGAHRFYVGKTGTAIAQLILTLTIVGGIVSGIWALVDVIVILSGGFKDVEGNAVLQWTK